MIRAIIFDCFGVLYRDNISLLYDIVPESDWKNMRDIIHATDHGFLTRQEYYQSIAELASIKTDEVVAIENRQHQRDQSMIDYAKSFRGKYKVALLSNIDKGTMEKLFPERERHEIFDEFFVSGEIGITKPSPKIFEIAAERLGLRTDECVIIDDMQENVEGASVAGMESILFTSMPNLKSDLRQILGS